jgi:hypothetical protein
MRETAMKIKMGAKQLVELGRKCRKGKIWRDPFTRRDGTRVHGGCVPDKGAPGKTPAAKRFAKFEPGYLPGWGKDKSAGERHAALRRQTVREGCVTVIRRLTQLRNVTTDRPTEMKAKADAKWLHGQNFCKLKTK